MSEENIKNIANLWDNIWRKHKKLPKQYGLSRLVFKILKREIDKIQGRSILEAGSGTGLSSFLLASKGAKVTLLDISPNAIKLGTELFSSKGISAEFKCASVFEVPYGDNSFDVVWNAGVIEHFKEKEQDDMLREMIRICRRDGLIILLNPNDKAPIYKFGKKYAEKIGRWGAGEEYPIKTLKPNFRKLGFENVKEYSVGFLQQLNFLEPLFVFIPGARWLWIVFYRIAQRIFGFLDYLPGYLLVTVAKKEADTDGVE
jgi:2-polyprenyl-3-methyl-5-hydroxy-6-metoxy-1,4-benzoquinol methylase